MKTELDSLSIAEIVGVNELLKTAIDQSDRWYTIKGISDMQRVHIALCEWLDETKR